MCTGTPCTSDSHRSAALSLSISRNILGFGEPGVQSVGVIQGPATSSVTIPGPGAAAGLKPTNRTGVMYALGAVTLLGGGIALARMDSLGLRAAGQVLVALASVQWFCLLHETGHGSLFRTRGLNRSLGHVAGFLSLIPCPTWCAVHAAHHRWTGWQDRDSTTESLTPRDRGPLERGLANLAWRTWIPLFSIAYRWNNFWNTRRLEGFLPGKGRAATMHALLHLAGYAALVAAVGPAELWRLVGPGLLVGLSLQDLLILSQHTHIPMPTSAGRDVRPRTGREQAEYTRSVSFPTWIGLGLLCGTGEHECHHVFPQVPGFLLHRIPWDPPRRVGALQFVREAKRLRGAHFLFENSNATGFQL